jgi:dolichyl-phosphate-mannose-protein mannosyltransferase
MACAWASKVNGILTVVCIGIAVLIDLWEILDYRRGYTMVCNLECYGMPRKNSFDPKEHFWRHFTARAIGLILWPFVLYLTFFCIHFAVLTHTGTGDTFMSPQFQETLIGNELLMNSQGLSLAISDYLVYRANCYNRDSIL